ncbi:MAG: hypothetical protein P1P84_02785 [Deferrisomatales bacterium]|nr:hypothetical protein [Deferrisomatales bacterium]
MSEHRWGPGETLDILVAHPDLPGIVGRITNHNTTGEEQVLLDGFAAGLVREAWADRGEYPGPVEYLFETLITVTLQEGDTTCSASS